MLLAYDYPRHAQWRTLAVVVLAVLGLYKLGTFMMLVRFTGASALSPGRRPYPERAEKVVDPLYRLVSKVREQACHNARVVVIDRPQGMFARPPGEANEPARTERLIASPTTVVHANASDTLDTIGFPLMARSGGANLASLLFEWLALAANIAIAAICASTTPNTSTEQVVNQLLSVLAIQVSMVAYAFGMRPSADRVMNLLVGTQFCAEACMTCLLLAVAHDSEGSMDTKSIALLVALASMLAPVVQRFYDAFIVQISKAVRKQGFTWKGAVFALFGLIVFLPLMVSSSHGLQHWGERQAVAAGRG